MIYFIFRRSDGSSYENFVSSITGTYVHVDLVIDNIAYTAYVNETFSENNPNFENPLCKTLGLEIPQPEEDKVKEWLKQQVEAKTPYNYSDLYSCVMPFNILRDTSHDKIKTLFCSQACIIALRMAVEENTELKTALSKVNSRSCTPNAFYKIIEPFCIEYK